MQFVWFYIPAPDNGLELKLSMRSVRKNFMGDSTFMVIGDKPGWYRGSHILCPRVVKIRGERAERLPFCDTQNKIVVAASHPEIDEEFCWIADDVYFLNPVSEHDLRTPRFDPWFRPTSRREWQKLIGQTFAALKAKGYPTLQFATHLPHVFTKTKLLQMFSELDYPNRLLLFELATANMFCENAVPYCPFLVRLQRPETVGQLDKKVSESCVLNYVSSCWNKTMKGWLQHRFPESLDCEG